MYEEVSAWSKPYSQKLKRFARDRIRTVENRIAVQLLRKDVNLGEAEAIVLALEEGVGNILIDDHKGRKIARAQGLVPIGSIGALLQAKRIGCISQVKPSLDLLMANGFRISRSLYEKALVLAGEAE